MIRFLLFVSVFFGLAACSGGRQGAQLAPGQLVDLLSEVWNSRQQPQKPITVTRALVDATPGAVLQAHSETLGQTAFLSRIALRDDAFPGRVSVWQSGDAAQLIFRDGVLVATRGLGGDILSSDATATLIALSKRQPMRTSRSMELRLGDESLVRLRTDCVLNNLGRADIRIVDQTIATRHMREICSGQGDGFQNDYWIGEDDLIWRSRQWGGPSLGYFKLTLLKN